jgi:hypothetical protein
MISQYLESGQPLRKVESISNNTNQPSHNKSDLFYLFIYLTTMMMNHAARAARSPLAKRLVPRSLASLTTMTLPNPVPTFAGQSRAFSSNNKEGNPKNRTFSTADATRVQEKVATVDMFCRYDCNGISGFYIAVLWKLSQVLIICLPILLLSSLLKLTFDVRRVIGNANKVSHEMISGQIYKVGWRMLVTGS